MQAAASIIGKVEILIYIYFFFSLILRPSQRTIVSDGISERRRVRRVDTWKTKTDRDEFGRHVCVSFSNRVQIDDARGPEST